MVHAIVYETTCSLKLTHQKHISAYTSHLYPLHNCNVPCLLSDSLQNAEPVACRDSMMLHIVRYYKLTINSGSISYSKISALLSHEFIHSIRFIKLVFSTILYIRSEIIKKIRHRAHVH